MRKSEKEPNGEPAQEAQQEAPPPAPSDKRSARGLGRHLRATLAYHFSVRDDQAGYAEIDSNIREMVEIKGTRLWVLMFAIIVASIGLNVNSTAVIIGAMLISPLMGPIMGIGYGIGINDFELIKKSFKSISIAAVLSILSAMLYFLITPLSEARSELLARTTPTLWDVLIALFGGLAGVLATTRKEKSDVIPGVAIATALMPPLCTAGYGLASGHFYYFFGAFYLFFINLVFIALATVLFIGYLNPPHKRFVDPAMESKVRTYIVMLVLATVLPSIYLAYNMVTDVAFKSRANEFIKNELTFDNTLITHQSINPNARTIDITLVGDQIDKNQLASIQKHLKNYSLGNARLIIHQSGDKKIDLASLKTNLLSDLYSTSQKAGEEKEKRIQQLEGELAKLRTEQPDGQSIAQELRTQYPMLKQTVLAKAPVWLADGSTKETVLLAYLMVDKPIPAADQKKIVAWLKVRTKMDHVRLIVSSH
jgi:uncharacterized hydrophobic protein (TIGR00271 family)